MNPYLGLPVCCSPEIPAIYYYHVIINDTHLCKNTSKVGEVSIIIHNDFNSFGSLTKMLNELLQLTTTSKVGLGLFGHMSVPNSTSNTSLSLS